MRQPISKRIPPLGRPTVNAWIDRALSSVTIPSRHTTFLIVALLVTIAAAPRLSVIGEVAVGQPQWYWRADLFSRAVSANELQRTLLAPHPGLTVLWIAGAAERLTGATSPFEQALATSWAVALFNLVCLAALLQVATRATRQEKLTYPQVAIVLVGLLLAFDATLIHMTALVGLDGTVSLLMAAALFAIYVHARDGARSSFLAAGVLTGLAVATKGAALILLCAPFLAAALDSAKPGRWRRAAMMLVLQIAASMVAVAALLPAAWIDPLRVVNRLVLGDWGSRESLLGVLNMPRPETLLNHPGAHGAVAYLAHILFRAAPAACLGVVAGLASSWFRRQTLVRFIACFALLYFATIALVPQQEWRYVLPDLVLLDVLGALGLYSMARAGSAVGTTRLRRSAVVAVVLLQAIFSLRGAPFYEFRMNPLVGGLPTAAKWIPIGWGSGLERAVSQLNDEASRQRHVLAWTGGYGFSGLRDRKGLEFEGPDTIWISPRVRKADPDCHVIYVRNPPQNRDVQRRHWDRKGVLLYKLEIDGVVITEVWCKPPELSGRARTAFATGDPGAAAGPLPLDQPSP